MWSLAVRAAVIAPMVLSACASHTSRQHIATPHGELCSEPPIDDEVSRDARTGEPMIAPPTRRACCHRESARRGHDANAREPLPPPAIDADEAALHTWALASIARHQTALDACYTCALAEHSDVAGREIHRFVVDASGRVRASAVARTDVSDPDLTGCASRAFARIHFPPRSGHLVMIVSVAVEFDARRGVIVEPASP